MEPRVQPIHVFLPPHLVLEIAQLGSPAQRAKAAGMLLEPHVAPYMTQKSPARMEEEITQAQSIGGFRIVYDAHHGLELPGELARKEGNPPTPDDTVNEAYDGSGAFYSLFNDVYGRDSIDSRGMPLICTVHY